MDLHRSSDSFGKAKKLRLKSVCERKKKGEGGKRGWRKRESERVFFQALI